MNLDFAAEQAARLFLASIRRVLEIHVEKQVVDRPHVILWHGMTSYDQAVRNDQRSTCFLINL